MAIADCSGLPIAAGIASASPHETTLVEATIDNGFLEHAPDRLIGDRAYDSNALDDRLLRERGIELIAPHLSSRRRKTQDGRPLRRYKRRWLIERLGMAAGPPLSLSVRDGSEGWAATLNDFLGGRSLKRLVIFSKGWEPPLLEFSDFLEALRASIGAAATLVVVPINTRGDGIEPGDREIWAQFLGRHGDPRLYVMEAS